MYCVYTTSIDDMSYSVVQLFRLDPCNLCSSWDCLREVSAIRTYMSWSAKKKLRNGQISSD